MIQTEEHHKLELAETMMNLNEAHAKGDISSIAVVIIRSGGDMRTMIHHNEGEKFPLLGGTDILHNQMRGMCQAETIANVAEGGTKQ